MKIPAIRARLHELSALHNLPELAELAEATKRRSPVRRAPRKSRPAIEPVREAIRAFASISPALSQVEIAAHFNINPGRVSEAMQGPKE